MRNMKLACQKLLGSNSCLDFVWGQNNSLENFHETGFKAALSLRVQRNSDGQHNPFLAAQNSVAQAVFRHMTADSSKQFKLGESVLVLSVRDFVNQSVYSRKHGTQSSNSGVHAVQHLGTSNGDNKSYENLCKHWSNKSLGTKPKSLVGHIGVIRAG